MARAADLAENGVGLARPNPMVGAVLVRDGAIVGEGWHEGRGRPHAEVHAARAAGAAARGATLYTTLEPCSHFGRTPPCAPMLVDAGIARVVVGTRDPNPVVDGRGLEILRQAGVAITEGVLADRCRELIEGFAKHVTTGTPFATLKMAASLDGRVAARDGSSRWVTGEAARRDVHRLRARNGAVIVGAGTAVADDPALTVRLDGYRGGQPLRVVVDASGRVPSNGVLFTDRAAPTVVATTESAPEDVRSSWDRAGAEVVLLERDGSAAEPRVSLPALMEWLGKREIQDALIEGGPELGWRAVEAGVVDRLVLYLAPKLVGGRSAPGILGGDGVATISDAPRVTIRSIDRVGDDVKVVADVHRHH